MELTQKIYASRGSCEMHGNQFLVGMASLVLEILLLFCLPSKMANFPFQTID